MFFFYHKVIEIQYCRPKCLFVPQRHLLGKHGQKTESATQAQKWCRAVIIPANLPVQYTASSALHTTGNLLTSSYTILNRTCLILSCHIPHSLPGLSRNGRNRRKTVNSGCSKWIYSLFWADDAWNWKWNRLTVKVQVILTVQVLCDWAELWLCVGVRALSSMFINNNNNI